jgi:hypothetical protein
MSMTMDSRDEPAMVVKCPALPASVYSVASTVASIPSKSRTSYCDLSAFGNGEQVLLPCAAFSNWDSMPDPDERQSGQFGTYAARRMLSRELSIESVEDSTGPSSSALELFTSLLNTADRISNSSGNHIRIQKLTTSKSVPYKTLLRRSW